jgi:ABC-type phosphate transport system substrate-binding protein
MHLAKLLMTAAAMLLLTRITSAEIVVVVNPKHPASAMTADEVSAIYLGKNSAFAPVHLPEASAPCSEFYTKVLGRDSAQVKAIWARLIFTGKVQPPKQVDSSTTAVKLVASNDKGIAYVEKSAVDATVKTVLIIE